MRLYQLLLMTIAFIPLFVIFINYLYERISILLLVKFDKKINRKEDDYNGSK